MTGTVFAMVLFAALLHATWNALVKVNTDRLTMMTVIVASGALISTAALPFVPFPAPEAWPYIFASVVLHTGYYLFLILAYRYGDLSHVYPIARGSSPLIVAAVTIFFVGEVLSQQETMAVVLIALGIISLTFTRTTDGIREPKAVIFALGTGLFIAGYTVADGLGARLSGSAHGYTFWLFALDGIPLTAGVLLLRRGRFVSELKGIWKIGLFAGLVSLLAYWIVIWAMTLAPMAMVSALRETSMLFAVLFGVFLLNEKLNLARAGSTFLTLVGAVMLKFSR